MWDYTAHDHELRRIRPALALDRCTLPELLEKVNRTYVIKQERTPDSARLAHGELLCVRGMRRGCRTRRDDYPARFHPAHRARPELRRRGMALLRTPHQGGRAQRPAFVIRVASWHAREQPSFSDN